MKVLVNVKMPKWDMTMTEGVINAWYKEEGDLVDKGEDLFEVKVEKDIRNIKAPAGGKVHKIFISAGKRAPVKVVVAVLADEQKNY
jgi:pyruvate dehydrogenase E2 component (dihydrolipoamide acetyltransferase)